MHRRNNNNDTTSTKAVDLGSISPVVSEVGGAPVSEMPSAKRVP